MHAPTVLAQAAWPSKHALPKAFFFNWHKKWAIPLVSTAVGSAL